MRTGLLGGSFDPIHNGHLKLAAAALRQLRLDRVYFVVSPRSPFKPGRRRTPAALRLRMVRLALRGKPRYRAADWEFKRRGPSYTVTTLRAFRRAHPKDDLFFITGTDALAGFPRWKQPAAIVKLARLAVGRRPGAAWPRLPGAFQAAVVRLKGVFPDVSSTGIRGRLRRGRATGVPADVERFIRTKGLYRA